MHCSVISRTIAMATFLLLANAHAADVNSAAGEQKRAAQKMFEAGDGLYESGRFDEAAQAFRASYDLVASPNSRLMLARSLRELRRYDEAYKEFQGTIRDAESSAGRYPDALNAARAEAEALGDQLAYLVVDAAPDLMGAELRINGKPTQWMAGEPIAVSAAKVEIELRSTDGKVRRESFELKASETRHVAPKVEPTAPPPKLEPTTTTIQQPAAPPPHSNGLRTGAYVAGGVGLVGLASFGVFGYLDHSTFWNLKSKCSGSGCSSDPSHDVDAGRRYQLFANIGLGVGAVGLATSVTLFLVSGKSKSEERPVALRLGPGAIAVDGRF